VQEVVVAKRKKTVVLVGSALLALTGQAAFADNGTVQEIIVTAQKSEETLQNTPIAMAALSGESLEKMGVVDYTGIVASTPSISFTPFPSSSDTLMVFMRGQGNGDPAQITTSGAVGLYEDGIYIARAQGTTFDLADVERVEVLRGPQGTLYGRNTSGGAVNIITRQPTGEFGFKQKFSFGTRNLFRSVTSVDLPQVGDVAAKVTLLKSSVDGYMKNPGNSHDFGEQQQKAGRLALRWTPSDTLSVDYAFEKGDIDSTPLYYQNKSLVGTLPGYSTSHSRAWRDFDMPLSSVNYEGHALTVTWDVNDNLTIKSLTGYRKLNSDYYQDYAEAFGMAFMSRDLINSHQFSQELQFIGSALDNRLQYTAGLYYFSEGGSHREGQAFPDAPAPYDYPGFYVTADSKSEAAFAQLTWTPDILDDRLDLTVGGRYTRDEPDATRINLYQDQPSGAEISNSQRFKRFNPMFTANFRLTSDINVYAKYATGYRAGGSNERGADFSQTYSPEKVATYEVGAKSYWWDHRVQANVAYFDTDYRDMQINVSPGGNPALSAVINAGRATIRGFEADFIVMPIDDLTLNASYAYLYSRIKSVEVGGVDMTGYYTLPYAPRHTYSIGADYTLMYFDKGSLAAHADYHWQDDMYLTGVAGPDVKNRQYWQRPGYGLLDARLTLALDLPRGDHARIGLWSKNLTDRKYYAHVNGNSPVSLTELTSQGYALGEPRSVGIDITYEY